MPLLFYLASLFAFSIGMVVGSFLNCVIYRLEKEESLMGRSYCPNCKHVLGWADLVPLASFLWLGGKCRYCRGKISWGYPLVELAAGMLFLLIFWSQFPALGFAGVVRLCFFWYLISAGIIIFTYDIKHYLIADSILFPAIAVTFLYRLWDIFYVNAAGVSLGSQAAMFGGYLLAAAVASAFFFSIFFVSRGQWMGFGDVKLAIWLGLITGLPGIFVALFLAFFLGAVIGTGLLLFKNKHLKSQMPFAPFLMAGTLIALFWGADILAWYSQFFVI